MMVYVWYPADRKSVQGKATASYLPGFDAIEPKLKKGDVTGMFRPAKYSGPDSLPETTVVDGAPVSGGRNKFPLLLFTHGWGNTTFLYTAELQDIVSHGYIVVSVDHPYDTVYTQFPDGRTVFFAQERFDRETRKQPNGLVTYSKERVEIMAEDNHYVLTQMLDHVVLKRLKSPFIGRIDAAKVGAFGHSIGGLTAARTCQIDARVKACMDQDSTDHRGSAFIVTDLDKTETQPFFLFVVSSADSWSAKVMNPTDADLASQKLTRNEYNKIIKEQQENQNRQMRSIAGGSYRLMLFDLPGFTHRSFTDQTLLASQSNATETRHNFDVAQAYTLAFFDKYLKGDAHTILDSGKVVDARAKLEVFPTHRSALRQALR